MKKQTLENAAYANFTTFRKTGVAVTTPVWFAPALNSTSKDVYYIFSANNAGKVKRLRNSGKSSLAPCTVTGKPQGETTTAQSRLLANSDDINHALKALNKKYGWQMQMTNFFSKISGKYHNRTYIEVTVKK